VFAHPLPIFGVLLLLVAQVWLAFRIPADEPPKLLAPGS